MFYYNLLIIIYLKYIFICYYYNLVVVVVYYYYYYYCIVYYYYTTYASITPIRLLNILVCYTPSDYIRLLTLNPSLSIQYYVNLLILLSSWSYLLFYLYSSSKYILFLILSLVLNYQSSNPKWNIQFYISNSTFLFIRLSSPLLSNWSFP